MPTPNTGRPAAERQTLDEIRAWHRGLVDALKGQRDATLRALRIGAPVAARFTNMDEADLYAYEDAQRRELDRLTVFNLVASVEAEVRVDYGRRVTARLKDPLSRAYRRWQRTLSPSKRRRPDFDQGGILDALNGSGLVDKNVIRRFRQALTARHWFGHGRYWPRPTEVDEIDPDEAYSRGAALLAAVPA